MANSQNVPNGRRFLTFLRSMLINVSIYEIGSLSDLPVGPMDWMVSEETPTIALPQGGSRTGIESVQAVADPDCQNLKRAPIL